MIIVKSAEIKDLPAIIGLVNELAVFENEPDAVTATLKEYEDAFKNKIFEALIAKNEESIVGMAIYYMTFSTWKGKMLYLEDLYVKEASRRMGIGQQLFDEFLNQAEIKGAKLCKWQVLDWNTPAVKFYEKNGAVIEKNWWNGKKMS